jgi:RND superfamily putative drug exporter
MLSRFARLALSAPRAVLLGALAVLLLTGLFGIPASLKLPAAGYDAPGTESARADQILQRDLNAGGHAVVITVRSEEGADSAQARARGHAIVEALRSAPYVHNVVSYWSTPPPLKDSLRNKHGDVALVIAHIAGDDEQAQSRADTLVTPLVGDRDGVAVEAGGQPLVYDAGGRQGREDLFLMESIAFPVTFLAMVWVFGSIAAAIVPLAVALLAVAISAASLSLINTVTNVSVFAVNLATALGLALAVDYTLLIVNRYREELASGVSSRDALTRTLNTAGRTISYSALTVALTISAMAVFPQYVVRSLAYGGLVSTLFALLGSLIMAPALLVVLGPRIDALDIRRPLARMFGNSTPADDMTIDNRWYRIGVFATRHAAVVFLGVGALALLVAAPAIGMRLGYPDDRTLPASASARHVGDIVRAEFTQSFAGTVYVVIPSGIAYPRQVSQYARALSGINGVVAVNAPDGIYAEGKQIAPQPYDSKMLADAAYLTISSTEDPYSDGGKSQLAALKGVSPPAPVLFGGLAQRNIDNVHGITSRIPIALGIIAAVTIVLIFLMTGSVILPIKALLMNVLSVAAGFGVLVWVFQDGHLHGLGTATTGYFTAFIPPLMACAAYALAMDYEVFVLSRIREEWVHSDRTTDDNRRAIVLGLSRTGSIVTAAAAIMIIVFIAMSAGQLSFMRAVGVGLTVGVAIDAFLIRPLLVPATMQLMGRLNWWAPRPLAGWHDKWGRTD